MSELARYEQSPAPLAMNDLMTLGKVLASSGYFDGVKDQAQAVVKILYGQELGIGPIAAMRSVYMSNGKPCLDAGLIASLIERSGKYAYTMLRLDDDGCELQIFKNGKPAGPNVTYTRKDAQQAGAFDGRNAHNYKKFPRNMFFARAITNAARWYCADIFSGPIYTRDELEDAAPVEYTSAPSAPVALPAPKPEPEIFSVDGTVSDLKQRKSQSGAASLLFKVAGVPLALKVADFDNIESLADGDEATVLYREETVNNKAVAVVADIRFSKPAPEPDEPGASFDPVEIPDEEPA